MGAAVTVVLPTNTVTGWGQDLLKLLARSVGLSESSKIAVKIRYGDNGEEEKLTGGRSNFNVICAADSDSGNIIIISLDTDTRSVSGRGSGGGGGSAAAVSRHPGPADVAPWNVLPEEEANYERMLCLFLKRPCIIPLAMQEVRYF